MTPVVPVRPRLSLPFTVIADGEDVHLIGGEDVRYTLHLGPLTPQFAGLLRRCDGCTPLASLLLELAESDRAAARELFDRLSGERILIEGPVENAILPARYRAVVEGSGPLVERLAVPGTDGQALAILCQDTLDLHAVREFNRRCLRSGGPWMWVTTGPANRGYVSPVFLPDAGPCLACLLSHFQRLSPAPQLYDALVRHAERGGGFTPAPFPAEGLTILEQIARWKVEQLRSDGVGVPASAGLGGGRPAEAGTPAKSPSAAVFRLHVLELETMEVSVHRVFLDPTCPECADARLV